jgi:hypothetical protein
MAKIKAKFRCSEKTITEEGYTTVALYPIIDAAENIAIFNRIIPKEILLNLKALNNDTASFFTLGDDYFINISRA